MSSGRRDSQDYNAQDLAREKPTHLVHSTTKDGEQLVGCQGHVEGVTYEYAESISMYSFPSGSHTLASGKLRYRNTVANMPHFAPFADSKTTGSGW